MGDSNKKMTLAGLTRLVTVNMMGSGIILLPASMAQIGAVSLLSWGITALGSMAIAYCFAQCGLFCSRSGGMSAYTEEAHGKSGFFMASYLYYLSLAIGNVAIAISAVGYMTPFFPWLSSSTTALFVGVVGLLCLTTVANFGGARITGRIGAITVWGVIIPVVGLSIIGWFWFNPSVFAQAWNPHNAQLTDAITASIPLTLWAFLGMESAAANSDAVENPRRNVSLACLFGTSGAASAYILSTTVIQGIVPNAELAASTAPFALVYARMFSPWVGDVILILAIAACLGSLLGWQFTLAQVSKAAAEQRMFPKLFAKVTASDAPLVGLLIACVLQTALAVSTMSSDASEQFSKLLTLAAVTNLIPYVTSLSALMIIMRKSNVEDSLFNRNVVVLMVAMLYSFYTLYASGKNAVFGAMIVMAIGYLVFGFIANRFNDEVTAGDSVAAKF